MKIHRLSLLFLLASLAFPRLSFSQLSAKESRIINQFDKKLSVDVKKDKVHGSISAAIIRDNDIVWTGTYGSAMPNNEVPVDTGSIYRIGSITKTFTATLLLVLADEKKVKLDEPVENYVPEVKNLIGYSVNTIITLRQLASHTSGLRREPTLPGARTGPVEEWENKTLASIPYTSFNSQPGTSFLYSNIGYAILGLALERAAGVPYVQLVQQKIFIPLHMDNTFFSFPMDKLPKQTLGIVNYDQATINSMSNDILFQGASKYGYGGFGVPNGGICSTPTDLAKFVIALVQKKTLLTPESLREMQAVAPNGKNYGLGLMLLPDDMIGHNGSAPGFTAQLLVDKRDGYAVILMRNYNKGYTNLFKASQKLLTKLFKN